MTTYLCLCTHSTFLNPRNMEFWRVWSTCVQTLLTSCQILTIFTPFTSDYHKEATANTPSFDESDLLFSPSSGNLAAVKSTLPKRAYSHSFYTLAVKIATMNGAASHSIYVLTRRLPIMHVVMVTLWCLQFCVLWIVKNCENMLNMLSEHMTETRERGGGGWRERWKGIHGILEVWVMSLLRFWQPPKNKQSGIVMVSNITAINLLSLVWVFIMDAARETTAWGYTQCHMHT